jgi:outer membrane protein assembly factor BamB
VRHGLHLLACVFTASLARGADWRTLHGNSARHGITEDSVGPPYTRKWARFWPGEILTTRMEAIVADGRVFVGTYAGRLHALDAGTGAELWTYRADGPVIHSPSSSGGLVYLATASPGWSVVSLAAAVGSVKFVTRGGEGGFSTSPLVHRGQVLLGGRDGVFYGLDPASGSVLFTQRTGGPIRNTHPLVPRRPLFHREAGAGH